MDHVIQNAIQSGVHTFVVPGTDYSTSQKAVELAEQQERLYAAVGIHPHHVYKLKVKSETLEIEIRKIEDLLRNPKVVAVGEVGIDRHYYQKTKYEDYQVDDTFMQLQKDVFLAQLELAKKYKKTVIIHNREAKKELLAFLTDHQSLITNRRCVFHCCEPDSELLNYAVGHGFFIGVDGDVTYNENKQEFVKKIPLEMLVLETDSPYLLPEPLRSQKLYPNEPKNIKLTAGFIAKLRGITLKELAKITTRNAKQLFSIQ